MPGAIRGTRNQILCQWGDPVRCAFHPAQDRNFTIVNCGAGIKTLVFRQFLHLSFVPCIMTVVPLPCYLHVKDQEFAAKPDSKSGYIIRSHPYCMFTIVNRKEIMNTHHAIIAGPAAGPIPPETPARAYPGLWQGRPVEQFSGIRSSGQFCRPMEPVRTVPSVTAHRVNRGRFAVHGMRP
jgi:hypothetical protein